VTRLAMLDSIRRKTARVVDSNVCSVEVLLEISACTRTWDVDPWEEHTATGLVAAHIAYRPTDASII
jgi:hypothetical protein